MANRSQDWFKQSQRDLEQAVDSRQAGRHEWACFAAQQAAEKALKALHLHLGQEAWEHVVARLFQDLPETVYVPPDLVEKGRVLDNINNLAQYAEGRPLRAPFEHYGPLQSEQALQYAGEILAFVRAQMA